MKLLRGARRMQVTSPAGTALDIAVAGARVGGVWGWCDKPGAIAHWPGGLCLCFPTAGAVNGTLVMAPGDINLTFKRYLETRVTPTVEDDFVTRVEGPGGDAALMESYFAGPGGPG